ncbi:MAG: biotin--[acetyl-CoA-carboxylase] ligase [Candidatus Omnitrophota bacterium]|nr:biotin--[acetyl-CoA-carboxylase] ligase [Candidatus Omnitrophota bacterium]
MKEFEIKKKIVSLFRENEEGFVSGEDISEILGFSRAGVWKYISKLRGEGYVIEAVPHLGYRLKSVPDRMYGYHISNELKTNTLGKKSIYYYESITSTNDRAYELAEEGEPEGTVVVAETQTRGKGRVGRKWMSPKGDGIYMSLILRPDLEMDEIPAVTLISALAIIKSIKKLCGLSAGMKWPNDVMIAGRKVCGILTEIKAQPDRVDFLILGIGINVNTSNRKLPPEGISLKTGCERNIDRTELMKAVLEDLEEIYSQFKKESFNSLRDECKALSSILGKRVNVVEHHRSVRGMAVDIDEKGALIVRLDNGILQRVFSGDVVLCR